MKRILLVASIAVTTIMVTTTPTVAGGTVENKSQCIVALLVSKFPNGAQTCDSRFASCAKEGTSPESALNCPQKYAACLLKLTDPMGKWQKFNFAKPCNGYPQ